MKWQFISQRDIYESKECEITIKNYNLWSKLGARLHPRHELAGWEFRFAIFYLGINTQEGVTGHTLRIPIFWMKKDHGVILHVF